MTQEIILTLANLPKLPNRKNLNQSISEKEEVNFNGFPIFPINWVQIYKKQEKLLYYINHQAITFKNFELVV